MKKVISLLLAVILMLSISMPIMAANSTNEDITIIVTYDQTGARTLLGKVNDLRTGNSAWYYKKQGSNELVYSQVSALTYDYSLEQIAMQRAAEVAVYYSNDHERPNGKGYASAYTISYSSTAELIIKAGSADEAYNSWLEANKSYNEQQDRRAMLSGDYTRLGAAHVIFNGNDYWVIEMANCNGSTSDLGIINGTKEMTVEVSSDKISKDTVTISPAVNNYSLNEDESLTLPSSATRTMLLTKTYDGKDFPVVAGSITWSVEDPDIAQVVNNTTIKGTEGGTTNLVGKMGLGECKISVTVNHVYGDWTVTKEPTCGIAGEKQQTCKCGYINKEEVAATGKHTMKRVAATQATCSSYGYPAHYECTACGKWFSDSTGTKEVDKSDIAIDKTAHSYSEWKIEKEATNTTTGLKTRVCEVCGHKQEITIAALDHASTCPSAKFTDVSTNTENWYHMQVDYCLDNEYMSGTSASTFTPMGTVTREQLVQVLYAMEGKPTANKSAGFKDVASGKWYENAINWAAENEIVSGIGDSKFGVGNAVKRQDMVLIMYKYASYKNYDTAINGTLTGFTDVSTVSQYAVPAMKWAVGHGIVSGTVNGIEPKANANRAQLAVILTAFDNNVK